jgi:integrase
MTERRRAKGEGTIRLRSDGRYEGREPPEIVPLGEKSRSFYGKSEREVAKKIRQARREREQGLNARSRQTVAAYLESWVAGPLKNSVARTTHQQYAVLVRKYLIPGIGKIKLAEITAQDLDDLYADMEERSVGERTARYVHQVISSALERAARKHLIPFNVARYADPPPMPESEEQLALTLEELSRFFKAAAGTRFENYFIVSAFCGARPQEILGLKWSDVELPKEPSVPGEATIRRRISIDGSGRWDVLDGTKTSRRNKRAKARAVYLMPEAVEALNRERKTYLEKRLRLAERWEETWRQHPETKDLIFPSETGGPMNRNNLLRRHFRPLAQKAGLPKEARLYTLRHTFATLWMESNEPVKVLQEILGHSRIDQTMNTYAHVMPHIQADAFGRFSRRFSQE